MDNILTAQNISKSFVGHQALDNVSIEVPRGKVYGLLGPNGAGKTTLIRIINHITAPDSGIVTFNGHPLTDADVHNIGYLPEERGLYKKMKVGEQALFFAKLKGLNNREANAKVREWFERLEITHWWDKKIEELSKGMAQKVQFVITVLHNPELLIFDEPFSGFDPINAEILKREILRLRDEGSTVIFSTHNMASVEELCDNITLINRSHNILSGPVGEIRARYSDHRYRVAYSGEPSTLLETAERLGADVSAEPDDKWGYHQASLKLGSDTTRREAIDLLNRNLDLRMIEPIIPSMHDIFVRAVSENDPEAAAQLPPMYNQESTL
ncbi:MAG: ATP-binding cassette domain-containing protein [Muribaculaceae bacterium]|nr:ATP-binding cassette domain-containing protein [Muribaculaceae bacterium]